MDYTDIVDRLAKLDDGGDTNRSVSEFIRASANQAAAQIRDDKCKIVDLIKGLNAILTNGSYEIRYRGVELMAQVVKALPTSLLSEKEIEVMTEFICLRLIDHKSMERPALECLTYFVECDNKPARYNKQIMEFIKNKANIRKMEATPSRRLIYELLKKFVAERKRQSNTMDGDCIYSLVTIMEGENNPDNLMLCFGIMSFILKNFDDLDPYIDDIFEWLTSYYPIDYTPSDDKAEKEGVINIQRLDLVEGLYECFYANPLNSECLQALLLEKLESNVMSTMLESLECLIKCYEHLSFPLASIVKYNSTLWTALRMNCLRKIETIDPKLLETSLRTLTSLAERLSSEDGDLCFTFVSDMYEELAIAFRKPEMDLFEPAAYLVTHAILPSVVGFNFVLEKILPICLNAIEANELRPLLGLAYMFEKLHQRHPEAKLKTDLDDSITKLVLKLIDLRSAHGGGGQTSRLLKALFTQRVSFSSNESLNHIIGKLWSEYDETYLDSIEECLALICVNYNRFDIITKTKIEKCDLDTLVRLSYEFDLVRLDPPEDRNKFSVYLRLLIIMLDKSTRDQVDALDQLVLNDSLARLREQLESLALPVGGVGETTTSCDTPTNLRLARVCSRSAIIHAIIVNKLAPNNANQVLMRFFSSSYCQNIVSSSPSSSSSAQDGEKMNQFLICSLYLSHVEKIFKSLVVRNHSLATPLINLVLNCITSERVNQKVAKCASMIFKSVLATGKRGDEDDIVFSNENHYQVFSLYKQKFYMQTIKEVRLRIDQLPAQAEGVQDKNRSETFGRLIYAVASQLVCLPLAVYKRDQDWLIRQILRILGAFKQANQDEDSTGGGYNTLFCDTYSCLESLMHRDLCDDLVPFLSSLIGLNLSLAQGTSSVHIRERALRCLAKLATISKESDLLVYRSDVVDKLRVCLADKKRVVRLAAGEARLRWITIGQPIGS